MNVSKWLGLTLGLIVAAGPAPSPAAEKAPASPGHGERAKAFTAAFDKGDAAAVAAFYAEDADYIDQAGHESHGRAAIQKLYEKTFAAQKGAKLTITVTSARLLSPDVALEDGVTEVAPGDGGPPTAARFAAVLVRKDGEWYLASVRDSVALPATHAEHLDGLAFLLGDWVGEEAKGESATASYAWANNRNFLVSSFATTLNGVPVAGGTQWIGWDAAAKQVRSWSFYSGGGFGAGEWTADGNKWLVKVSATTADGKKVSVVNVLTKTDDDHVTMQTTKLTVDGQALPDAAPVRMKRVK